MDIVISIFESTTQAFVTPDSIMCCDWEDVVAVLLQCQVQEEKTACKLFNLWDLQGEPGRKYRYEGGERTEDWTERPGTIRRCRANAVACYGLVLDFDNGATVQDALYRFDGLECCIYTTHSHTEAKNKFRVVIPFAEPLTQAELTHRRGAFEELFGSAMDHVSFSLSQSFYLHSAPEERKHLAFSKHLRGEVLDAKSLPEVQPPTPAPVIKPAKPFTEKSTNEYKARVLDSLYNATNIRYASALKVATLVRSIDETCGTFEDIIRNGAPPDSSIHKMTSGEVAKLWNMPGDRMTKAVREKLLEDIGSPPCIRKVWTHADLLQLVKRSHK